VVGRSGDKRGTEQCTEEIQSRAQSLKRRTDEACAKHIGKKKKDIEARREKKKDIEAHLGKMKDRRSTREARAKHVRSTREARAKHVEARGGKKKDRRNAVLVQCARRMLGD